MLTTRHHGDVTEVHATTRLSRMVGYGVSAFRVRDRLVDTLFPRVGRELAQWLTTQRPLHGIVLTHAHEDHAGNIATLAATGVAVDAADATLALVTSPAPIALYRRATWGSPTPLHRIDRRASDPSLQRIHTPGHSADHHVVWDHTTGSCFGGDLFIGVKVRISHVEEDHRATIASLRRIVALAPARYFDAHRGLVPDAARMLQAKADWLDETVTAIETRIQNGETDDAIRRIVLGCEDLTGMTSRGEYSRLSMVRAIRARLLERADATAAPGGHR
jgi:endoribonuclease LACTB2